MPEDAKDQGSQFVHRIAKLAHGFSDYRQRNSVTFGDEGEALEKKKDELYGQIVNLTAEEVIQQTETKKIDDILETTLQAMYGSAGIRYAESYKLEFVKSVLFRTIEIMKPSPPKNLQE